MQASSDYRWSVRCGASISSLIDIRNKVLLNFLKFLNEGIGQVTAKNSSQHQFSIEGRGDFNKTHKEIDTYEIL